MAKIKAEIIATGTVQKVGYRDRVQEIARKLGVKGYVENQRDGSVKIVCETDKETLQNFIKLISLKEDLIDAENIEIVKTQPATGEYEYFDIKYGSMEEEMGERMVAAVKIASATRLDIKSMHTDLKDTVQSMHGDMKTMHKDLKESIQTMHMDLKESIGSMHTDLKESIQSMHTDLKDTVQSMHQDMKIMHKDLKTSIQSMHQDMKIINTELKDSVQSMHQDINQNFKEMATTYDAISTELLRTREELKRAVDNLVKVVEKFLEKTS